MIDKLEAALRLIGHSDKPGCAYCLVSCALNEARGDVLRVNHMLDEMEALQAEVKRLREGGAS